MAYDGWCSTCSENDCWPHLFDVMAIQAPCTRLFRRRDMRLYRLASFGIVGFELIGGE